MSFATKSNPNLGGGIESMRFGLIDFSLELLGFHTFIDQSTEELFSQFLEKIISVFFIN
jgi:hypothetical protein